LHSFDPTIPPLSQVLLQAEAGGYERSVTLAPD